MGKELTEAEKRRIGETAIPDRVKSLPIDKRGYPVPFFVAYINGEPDHRIADPKKKLRCIAEELCWICGYKLGGYKAFVIGPMCSVNRISADPAMHLECAEFSVKICPFLTNPKQVRRTADMPELAEAPGQMICRNPGVMLIWVTRSCRLIRDKEDVLFRVGDPVTVQWFAEGRPATREEIMESIETGLPVLIQACNAESDGFRRTEALAALQQAFDNAMTLVPAA